MDQPVPPSSQGSDDALGGRSRSDHGQGRPTTPVRTAEVGSLRVDRSSPADDDDEADQDDGFDSEEFRAWMRNRGRQRGTERRRHRTSSAGSDGYDDGRTNAGPAPEWDGESLVFQDYVIKARLWLATTRSKPRTRGPLLLSKLSKTPFETMKFLAKDSKWMQSDTNGEELINMMDLSEYFGDDRDEDLLSALAKVTYHVRREKNEAYRTFFNRWESAYRKVTEHKVQLPDKYIGFLLIQALCLNDQEIKSVMNFTHGSIMPKDIKEWVRKHETKLQVNQVGVEKKNVNVTKGSGHYMLNEDETDLEDEEIFALETAIRDLQDGEPAGDLSGAQEDEGNILEEHEAVEILSTMLSKKRNFAQSQKAKKAKELGRGYHNSGKGRGKSFTTTTGGRQPFKSGQYRMTIEEVKKVTKCGHCHKVGHWHRECPDLHRGSGEKEQHYLQSEEATFCGMLEVDGKEQVSPMRDQEDQLSPGEAGLSGRGECEAEQPLSKTDAAGSAKWSDSFEHVKPMSRYKDRGCDDWEVFLGEMESVYHGVSTNHWASTKNANHLPDEACATVDTGCQRMAIGIETLKKLAKHLPEELPVHLHKQEHRFRSVHGRSVTSQVAVVPTGLGRKGSVLKPAVFENPESRNAPFLISLPFLMFCRSTLFLDPIEGLRIYFKQFDFSVPCHIRPSGALRIPLCLFSKTQINQLSQLHEQFKSTKTEFEVLKTECNPEATASELIRPKEITTHHDVPPTRDSSDGVRTEEIPSERPQSGNSGGLVSNGPQIALCDGSGQRASDATASNAATCGSRASGLSTVEDEGTNNIKDIGYGNFPDTSKGIIFEEHGRLRRDLRGEWTVYNDAEVYDTKHGEHCCRTRSCDRSSTTTGGASTAMRTSRDNQALCVPQTGAQLQEDLLAMPTTEGIAVCDLHLVRDPAVPRPDLPERSGARGLCAGLTEINVRNTSGEHHHGASETLPSHQGRQERDQPVQDHGEVRNMWQGTQVRENRAGEADGGGEESQEDRARLPGVPRVEEIWSMSSRRNMDRSGSDTSRQLKEEAMTETEDGENQKDKGVKHVLNQAQTALGETAEMWQNLITLVQSNSPEPDKNMAKMAKEIFDVQNPSRVSDRRQLKRLASLLGVTKKKARLVAEVFNPERFGPRTHRHGLDRGAAFDLTLGDNLLDSRQRQSVRNYVNEMKPGLVVISTPCTMLSQLQNLNVKHLTNETKHREFIKRLIQAKVLLNFSCEICERVMSYGGTFLLEQPRTSKAWKEPKVQKLAALPTVTFTVNDQCMFGLKSTEGFPHKKPTGWLCNNAIVAKALDRQCDHTHEHLPVFGSGPGGSRSKLAQEYPKKLVDTILGSYARSLKQPLQERVRVVRDLDFFEEIYHTEMVFNAKYDKIPPIDQVIKNDEDIEYDKVPKNTMTAKYDEMIDTNEVSENLAVINEEGLAIEDEEKEHEEEDGNSWLPRERPLGVEQLVRRAHCGLGHLANARLARILHQAGARKEAVEYAKNLKCDVCQRHRQIAPARAAAPPRELTPNQIVGVDTIYLPGLQFNGKRKMALNIIDWATKFQLVIPLHDHTPRSARQAFLQWTRIFGTPERVYDDLGKEFRGCFEMMMDQDAIFLDPGSLESPTQRSLTERAGRTYKEVFSKTLMEVTCNNWDEWHEVVDVVTATINRLANKSGYSPIQRMLGYSPRIPGSLMSGGFNDQSTASRYAAGDLQVQRSVDLRTAAAIAYHKADCEQALRNSLHAGPRVWQHYEVGQTVYYWKKGMERGKKNHPYFWHGPAKVILTNLPTTVWVAHRGRIVKACPEHLRPIAEEEKFILTDWIQDILDTKKKLKDGDYKGYIVLDEKPPDALDFQPEINKDFIGPLPPQAPRYRLTGKHRETEVEFQPDACIEKRRRLEDQEQKPELVLTPRSLSIAPTTPARTEDLEPRSPNEEVIDSEMDMEKQSLPEQGSERHAVIPEEINQEAEDDGRGQVRHGEHLDEDEERPTKRQRAELLETMFTQLEQANMNRKRKEINYKTMDKKDQRKFDKAILKEIKNNLQSGAYQALTREESEQIRRDKPDLIMKSRYVLTEKPVEPHEVEPLQKEGLLLDNNEGEVLKAKARHVMKGYSEANAEDLESTTPQVAKDTVFFVLQILASMKWIIGHLDFTQAFHSGDKIARELYCSLPPEGVPGLHDRQLLKLLKTCYGLTDGPYQW